MATMMDPSLVMRAIKEEAAAERKLKRRVKRREYIRTMMQQYRQREKQDLARLRAEVASLEVELRHLGAKERNVKSEARPHDDTTLSWKDVALALLGERQLSFSEKQRLARQVAHVSTIAWEMNEWVAVHCPPLHVRALFDTSYDFAL
ncbi:Aste57867_2181 [Aphanomyces stellatus]|uniref:Aste57867_2181 protein n=1 Tax=Aphanomyces stellatus TaxID=120398 RepID=A0A485KC52_9STRA|nr:hypothetical protein As57867_002176 [Aphanomyces stellatus]VFT79384.1 Aste57867_2181 [Aphanomyces stellatus]